MKLKAQNFKLALQTLLWGYAVMCRFFIEIRKGKIIEKNCHCGQTYKDHKRIEKRHIPVCDDCLPF
jgi:predicted SprT family Zn-dependent metalloprotease